jgi:ABC-type uncharacterized transport system fused permease/ATPase subunit
VNFQDWMMGADRWLELTIAQRKLEPQRKPLRLTRSPVHSVHSVHVSCEVLEIYGYQGFFTVFQRLVDVRHLNCTFIIPTGTVIPAQGSHTQIEADMARGQNILLLGARGSGKSAIVRALGHGKWLLWQHLNIFMMRCCVKAGFQGAYFFSDLGL